MLAVALRDVNLRGGFLDRKEFGGLFVVWGGGGGGDGRGWGWGVQLNEGKKQFLQQPGDSCLTPSMPNSSEMRLLSPAANANACQGGWLGGRALFEQVNLGVIGVPPV